MKGIIFNLVEDAVVAEHGAATWDRLLDDAGVEGAYTALGNYPDEDLMALVGAGSSALDVDAGDLTRHLGRAALAGLAERYPHFFAPHTAVRPFLLTLNDVIHPEVRKLQADAEPPEFWFEDGDDGPDDRTLLVHYRSTRRLCALADGMIQGAARHYGQEAVVEHRACQLEGDDHCVLHTTFVAA